MSTTALSLKRSSYLHAVADQAPANIVLFGPPASGKGTQAELLVAHLNLIHISTGDLLRSRRKFLPQLAEYMDNGKLVPDDVVSAVLKERLAENDCLRRGVLLDGFPRTLVQAEALRAAGIHVTSVIHLDVADDIVVERIAGRRIDPISGKVYHINFNPPPTKIAQRVIQREDDTAEKIRRRLLSYHEVKDAMLSFYGDQVVRVACGNLKPHEVFEKIRKLLCVCRNLVLFGPPASGKGTQAALLTGRYGMVHISTGDLLRQRKKFHPELAQCMDNGKLVPDGVVSAVLKERLAEHDCLQHGVLLDGFPRTLVQAEALRAANIEITYVIHLEVADDIVVERIAGRRIDPISGKVYHTKWNPAPPEIAERTIQREDDTAEKIHRRLVAYHEAKNAILSFYGKQVLTIDCGTCSPDEVFEKIRNLLDDVAGRSADSQDQPSKRLRA